MRGHSAKCCVMTFVSHSSLLQTAHEALSITDSALTAAAAAAAAAAVAGHVGWW